MAYTPGWMESYQVHGHNFTQGFERHPHVHVRVGGGEATVSLETFQFIHAGDIPKSEHGHVLDWVVSHRADLMTEWNSKSNFNG